VALHDRIFEPFSGYMIAPLQGWGSASQSLGVAWKPMGGQIRPTDTPGGGLTMIISLLVADHPVTSDTESPRRPAT
jgi:hypothetical protein